MNELVEKVEISFSLVSLGFLNQLLLFLGKSGKIETMMKVINDFLTCQLSYFRLFCWSQYRVTVIH